MDVGEAEVAAGVVVGEFLVIEAEEVENGGLEIVDVDGVFGGGEAEFVGGAVDVTALHSTAGHPHGEAVVVVVAAFMVPAFGSRLGHFHGGGAAEFAAPDDEGFVEEAALFEIGE